MRRNPSGAVLAIALLIGALAQTAFSQSVPLSTRIVATDLRVPWEILWGPDDWIWVTERNGPISRINPETGEKRQLTIVPSVYNSEEPGLLGMVLHPNFIDSPYVFVACNTYREPQKIVLRIIRYTYSYYRGRDTLVGPVVILDSIQGENWRNGCRLLIDDDRTMFATIGDAGRIARSQDPASLNGKIIRMNLDGSVPADNPFASAPWPASLVWSSGHRNPQGIVRLPNGRMYAAEHGENHDDEVNLIERGRNYGWPNVTGPIDDTVGGVWNTRESLYATDSAVLPPVRSWTPTIGPAGLGYYNHPHIPQWRNSLLLLTLGKLKPEIPPGSYSLIQMRLSDDGSRVVSDTAWFSGEFGRLRDLCISPDGRVFVATSNRDGRASAALGFPTHDDDRIIEIRSSYSHVPLATSSPRGVVPQPVVDHAVVMFGQTLGRGRVEIYSHFGERVRSEEFEGGESYLFERGRLAAGVYLVCVNDRGRSVRVSVVVR